MGLLTTYHNFSDYCSTFIPQNHQEQVSVVHAFTQQEHHKQGARWKHLYRLGILTFGHLLNQNIKISKKKILFLHSSYNFSLRIHRISNM